jgi:predicted lipase
MNAYPNGRARVTDESLTSLLNKHEVEDYLEAESIDIFDKNIIHNIVSKLADGSDDFNKYIEWIDNRKTKHWYQTETSIVPLKMLLSFISSQKRLNTKASMSRA